MNFDFKLVVIFAVALVSSGCVSMNINHEIHKDGSSDVAINVRSDSQTLRNNVKERFGDILAVENAVLEEGDDYFTYRFENIYPQRRQERFSDVMTFSEESSEYPSFGYEKDSGPIYTDFTLRINSTDLDSSETNYSYRYERLQDPFTSGIEVNYNVDPFGEIVDTNGQEMGDGTVRFDLTEDENYYIEFRALTTDVLLSNLVSTRPEPPEWEFSEWSECSRNGTQTRSVELQNNADNYMIEPRTQRSCEYQTQLSAQELVLDSSTLTDYSVEEEVGITGENIEQAYQRTFSKENATLQHTVIKPSISTQEYIDNRVSELESEDYEGDITYISGADSTEAYSKTVGTENTTQGNGYYRYEQEAETMRKIVLASKYDVVHKFTLEGRSRYGLGIEGIDDFNSVASEAVTGTE